jgi:hypothetical protein
MGHERIGVLPKSEKWRSIVAQISDLPESDYTVAKLVSDTLTAVRQRYEGLLLEPSLHSTFSFLVILSVAARGGDPIEKLRSLGIEMGKAPTPLSFARALKAWLPQMSGSEEHSSIIRAAGTDVITSLYPSIQQRSLFGQTNDPFEPWRTASSGRGFCEVARTFFAKLTERYLNYFLEREASSALSSFANRTRFSGELETYVEKVSRHAFETASITQSFAAGWYNKNTKETIPTDAAIYGFLAHALDKMREELAREEFLP